MRRFSNSSLSLSPSLPPSASQPAPKNKVIDLQFISSDFDAAFGYLNLSAQYMYLYKIQMYVCLRQLRSKQQFEADSIVAVVVVA